MDASLVPATRHDIPAIMAIERTPGYENLVGRWENERHLEELGKTGSRYVVWARNGDVEGFAILQGIGSPNLRTHLKRIAVAEPGTGSGTRLLRDLVDWVFRETDTNRLDLDVYVENERARRAYEKVGFTVEGTLRDWLRSADGNFHALHVMSLLRREWIAA